MTGRLPDQPGGCRGGPVFDADFQPQTSRPRHLADGSISAGETRGRPRIGVRLTVIFPMILTRKVGLVFWGCFRRPHGRGG
jgi:hypothetical protein